MQTIRKRIHTAENKYNVNVESLPVAPPIENDHNANKIMDCIRDFELHQMSYQFQHFQVCHERHLEMKMTNENTCSRSKKDKNAIKMFSDNNKMNPMPAPDDLKK